MVSERGFSRVEPEISYSHEMESKMIAENSPGVMSFPK